MRTFFSMSVLSFFFPQKSGDADNRPPSMAIMFDGVQFFSFSLDIVRPECSVSIDAIVAAAKTKYSKKIIQFKRSHDISWLIVENDCQGEVCVLRARFQCR